MFENCLLSATPMKVERGADCVFSHQVLSFSFLSYSPRSSSFSLDTHNLQGGFFLTSTWASSRWQLDTERQARYDIWHGSRGGAPVHLTTMLLHSWVALTPTREANKLTAFPSQKFGCPLLSFSSLKCYSFTLPKFHYARGGKRSFRSFSLTSPFGVL